MTHDSSGCAFNAREIYSANCVYHKELLDDHLNTKGVPLAPEMLELEACKCVEMKHCRWSKPKCRSQASSNINVSEPDNSRNSFCSNESY